MNPRRRGLLRPHESKLDLLARTCDAVLIGGAYQVVCRLLDDSFGTPHTVLACIAVLAFHFIGDAAGLYKPWRGIPVNREAIRVITSWAAVVPLLLLFLFMSADASIYRRNVTLAWFALAPTLVVAFRLAVRLTLQELRRRGRNTRAIAIVGATESGLNLARKMVEEPWSGMVIYGFYDDRDVSRRELIPSEVGQLRGNNDQLIADARAGKVDLVYITLPLRAEPRIASIIRQLSDTTASVYIVADFYVYDLLQGRWGSVGDIPVVAVHETPFYGVDGWLKRIEDIVLGTMILGIIAIPMLAIAIGVKLTSKGPVFFRQRRYGLNGEEIHVLKFRSMTVMEDGGAVKQATRNDPRVTKFGAFLRRTSLDELPQFLNVLAGSMSIVGPRPHAVAHNEEYRRKIHGYMLRHKVKPGITGWAQVNGWRGETDTLEKMEKRVEHDLEYIRNWGLLWDIKIIVLTAFGRAKKNAY